jgi:hypothetical protein
VPFDDQITDPTLPVRSLSEQLRDVEERLDPASDVALPPGGRMTKLPTCLGRPIGLVCDGFPRIARRHAEDEDDRPPGSTRAGRLRHGATVLAAGLALLATTAILPPLLLRPALPEAAQPAAIESFATTPRTGQFAESARALQLAAAPSATSAEPAATAYFEPAAAVGEASDIEAILLAPPRGLAAVRRAAPTGPSDPSARSDAEPPPWLSFGTRSAP